jgi:chloramphenicol 3-O phosphotransferase
MSGQLVVLNGASSSGKTMTAAALAACLGPKCWVTGLDEIMERIRPLGNENAPALLRSLRVLVFQLRDGRLRLFQQLHREVAAEVIAGRDVIVETALMDRRALNDAARQFAPLGGYFVALKPPLEVSEAWEATRGDRPVGQARRHYDAIHAHGVYDLVLDPSQRTPEACAGAILERIQAMPAAAFQQLHDSESVQLAGAARP